MKTKSIKESQSQTLPTYWQILDAARELFAEYGYRDTTIRMISQKANVNGAAINYYFRSKETLYKTLFVEAFQKMGKPTAALIPAVKDQATWEISVNEWFKFILNLFLSDSYESALVRRLVGKERVDTTEFGEALLQEIFYPTIDVLLSLIKMAVPNADAIEKKAIFLSYLSQCSCYIHRDPPWDKVLIPDEISRDEWIAILHKQITGVFFRQLSFQTTKI